jgi:ribosome-binding protein aMBF1 (putative translation factor)
MKLTIRKVINGKRYYTDTAAEIAVISKRHLSYYNLIELEGLYKKKTGEYFIASGPDHESESKSDFIQEEIVPITKEMAEKWGREYMSEKAYQKAFLANAEPEPGSVLGKTIKRIRLSKNMSQSELAEKIDVTQSRITRYEHGEEMTITTFRKIAVGLGIKAAQLMYEFEKALYAMEEEI